MLFVFILVLFDLIKVSSLLLENLRQLLSLKELVFAGDLHLVCFQGLDVSFIIRVLRLVHMITFVDIFALNLHLLFDVVDPI